MTTRAMAARVGGVRGASRLPRCGRDHFRMFDSHTVRLLSHFLFVAFHGAAGTTLRMFDSQK